MNHNIPKELSDVQYTLLGLIFEKELTGTELRKKLRDQFQWDTSTSSFYTYFDRLAAEKYCSVKSGKRSKRFRITAKGKKTFLKKLSFHNGLLKTWKKLLK